MAAGTFSVLTPMDNASLVTEMNGNLALQVTGKAEGRAGNSQGVTEIEFLQDIKIYLNDTRLDPVGGVVYTAVTSLDWEFQVDYSFNALASLGTNTLKVTVTKTETGKRPELLERVRTFNITRAADTQLPTVEVTAPTSVNRTPDNPEPKIEVEFKLEDFYSGLASVGLFLDDIEIESIDYLADELTATVSRNITVPFSRKTTRQLKIEVYDRAGNVKVKEIGIEDPDVLSPEVAFTSPVSDLPYPGSAQGSVIVPLIAKVHDFQSGLASVEWRLDDEPFVALEISEPNSTSLQEWKLEVPVSGRESPHSFDIRARDGVGHETIGNVSFSIGPVSSETIDQLLSPAAYLRALLNFTSANVKTGPAGNDVNVSPKILTAGFSQEFQDLANQIVPGANRPICDLLTPVRLFRINGAEAISRRTERSIAESPGRVRDELVRVTALAGHAVADYHRRAYEALLAGLGASFEEVRTLNLMPPKQRADLANRLGLSDAFNTPWIAEIGDVGSYSIAGNRVAVLKTEGALYVKEGALIAPWSIIETGDVRSYAMAGDRIAVLKTNGLLYVKEGALNANWVAETGDVQSYAIAGDRIAVLKTDGILYVKEGGLYSLWIAQTGDVQSYAIAGRRIAVLKPDGMLYVKEGALDSLWIAEMGDVQSYAIAGDRIAVLKTDGLLYVKEGALNANWVAETGDVQSYAIAGNRIAVLKTDGILYVKEGGLYSLWIAQTGDVQSYAIAGRRIAVLKPDGMLYVKEGALNAPWTAETGDVQTYAIAGDRIAVLRTGGILYVKERRDGDRLDVLLPPSGTTPGTDAFEDWLFEYFGLTKTNSFEQRGKPDSIPRILLVQQALLVDVWERDDLESNVPDIDPDLCDAEDLSRFAAIWLATLDSRQKELVDKYDALIDAANPIDAVSNVFSPPEQSKLREIEKWNADGKEIGVELENLQLSLPIFRRLLGYLKLIDEGSQFSLYEREDLANLLVQRWKAQVQYSIWRAAELAITTQRLWPTPTAEAAWVVGNVRSNFPPWRGSAGARTDLERRLASRLRAWQQQTNSLRQAVSDAQRAALPGLRDGLLGVAELPHPQQLMDDFTQRWLIDFAATGATALTPIEQATSSLQTLINGVRSKWFESPHPAHDWVVSTDDFEAQWTWLESFGRWRTAVANYLYPENVLYPELKDDSPLLKTFLVELAKLRPLSTAMLKAPPREYVVARDALPVGSDDREYFVPVAIGLALQRAGLYTAALDQYRLVYDPVQKASERKIAAFLKVEDDNEAPVADFGTSNWTVKLSDPHTLVTGRQKGKGRCNPYTRFTLFQILNCMISQADDAFASGTRDGRARALALYLEAGDILEFDELRDRVPVVSTQVYLPSPILTSLQDHVGSALRKIRQGLTYLGTPLPPDLTRGADGAALSSLVRPTPYRYRVLMERAKQLTSQAQQLEAQYLSAIEHGDAEVEKYLAGGFAVASAEQTVSLKALQEGEAKGGEVLANYQRARSQIQLDRYADWIAKGETEHEKAQINHMWESTWARDGLAVAKEAMAVTQAVTAGLTLEDLLSFGGTKVSKVGLLAFAASIEAGTQSLVNHLENATQLAGIYASQERRTQDWLLQRDISLQDVKIGDKQVALTQDRIAIAIQESKIAESQRDNAKQMLAFLGSKFTSVRFYQWFVGELAQIYATFLRLAAATAHLAEMQLAFERQEQPIRMIKADYWLAALNAAASASSSSVSGAAGDSSGLNPRGITGSSRLLQDLYMLDEHAFSSERRLLNLSQSFSLTRSMPVEFEEFRRTGLLAFSTPMLWFDEGFPGHYMRLVKRVRLSVAALIPPGLGIRATFANGGLSRVVTADAGYPTMVIRQDPQMVALTSPMASTGVFELDTQAELLYPFEGTGVDTTWYLELPPAGNPFDFDALMDVVLSIDYTAQFSPELRDRVVKKLPRTSSGDRSFSVRREFPDAWYEIANGSGESGSFGVPVSRRSFPPGLTELRVTEVSVSARTTEGTPCAFQATLEVTLVDKSKRKSDAAVSIGGIASSRRAGGAGWHRRVSGSGQTIDVIDNMPFLSDAEVLWTVEVSNQADSSPGAPPPVLQQLRDGKVEDILVVMTFAGVRRPWGMAS